MGVSSDMKNIKIVIERHEDDYVGYPLGFTRGAIVGQGDTFPDALKDTQSAIEFFIEHYGIEKF
jgi:predicted RNase H-like HicB family nuclease